MGYNLRHSYLLANKDFANDLIKLAETRGWNRVVCNNPEEAMALQYRVNNVLYSLAHWEPARAWVRDLVRTKLAFEGESHVVYLGVPPVGTRLRGAPPQVVHMQKVTQGDTYLVDEAITPENWTRISLGLITAAKSEGIRQIRFAQPPNADGIRFLSEQMADFGFTILQSAPELVLSR